MKETNFDSARLRELRLAAGLTREELALRTGTSYSTIVRWESGRQRPWGRHRAVLAAIFRVDPYAFTSDAAGSIRNREAAS